MELAVQESYGEDPASYSGLEPCAGQSNVRPVPSMRRPLSRSGARCLQLLHTAVDRAGEPRSFNLVASVGVPGTRVIRRTSDVEATAGQGEQWHAALEQFDGHDRFFFATNLQFGR